MMASKWIVPALLLLFASLRLGFAEVMSEEAASYRNPVIDSNHPDPGVLKLDDGSYIAVTTTGNADNAFVILHSPDLVKWERKGFVFPGKNKWPSWAVSDFWAPEMHKVGAKYLVYFTARTAQSQGSLLSIGVAHGDNPYGPFTDIGSPLQCNKSSKMGSIDATYFYDAGMQKHFLIWKSDGNAVSKPTDILLKELSADGLSFKQPSEKPTFLFTDTEFWEKNICEGPWVTKRGAYYYIFYSGSGYADPGYAVGVVRSKSLLGPYEKYVRNPILHTDYDRYFKGKNCTFVGPGHNSVVAGKTPDELWIVYHAWRWDQVKKDPGRVMLIDKIEWTADNWPSFANGGYPTDTPQPAPFQAEGGEAWIA